MSLGTKACASISNGWKPHFNEDNKLKHKTVNYRLKVSQIEYYILYVIFNGVNSSEFIRINTCKYAKEI